MRRPTSEPPCAGEVVCQHQKAHAGRVAFFLSQPAPPPSSFSLFPSSALHHPAASTSTSYPTPTIIVADGGSTDGTRSAAARAGATTILRCPTRGRGAQLAAGLAAADADGAGPGDVILFLHADAALPDG